jgi:hypothetical protein
MQKKKIILIALAAIALMMTGCLENDTPSGEQLSDETNVDTNTTIGESYAFEIKATEANQNELVRAQPPIQLESSLERENLIRRYEHLNDRNQQHHVYLMSNDGKVIAYYVAKGKVSSVNSKLTNNEQIVGSNQCIEHEWVEDEGSCYKTVESPQMDGSYGTNGDAIFFFRPEGQYVEANTKYIVSEEPMNIKTALSLKRETQYDGGDVGNTTNAP